jgi:hypothetical protein
LAISVLLADGPCCARIRWPIAAHAGRPSGTSRA